MGRYQDEYIVRPFEPDGFNPFCDPFESPSVYHRSQQRHIRLNALRPREISLKGDARLPLHIVQ